MNQPLTRTTRTVFAAVYGNPETEPNSGVIQWDSRASAEYRYIIRVYGKVTRHRIYQVAVPAVWSDDRIFDFLQETGRSGFDAYDGAIKLRDYRPSRFTRRRLAGRLDAHRTTAGRFTRWRARRADAYYRR